MPRRSRCVLPGIPCHITQRGVDRCETFSGTQDRATYLRLLRDNLADAQVAVWAYCLMTNHVHLIMLPEREDSLAVLLRRLHGRYAQYFNTRSGRSGHLWQNRFFACALDEDHLWTAMAYGERNPVRAGMVQRAGDYRWSSAAAHLGGAEESGVLDMRWWQRGRRGDQWAQTLDGQDAASEAALRRCTYAGKPFGSESFVAAISERFGRHWVRGRPSKQADGGLVDERQMVLLAD
jgi:putative transposase